MCFSGFWPCGWFWMWVGFDSGWELILAVVGYWLGWLANWCGDLVFAWLVAVVAGLV